MKKYSCGVGSFGAGGSPSSRFRVGDVPTVTFVKTIEERKLG